MKYAPIVYMNEGPEKKKSVESTQIPYEGIFFLT